MVKADSKPLTEEEIVAESDIESIELKDGAGYGDLQSLNAQPDQTNRDAETYVGRRAPEEVPKEIKRSETYIQERKSYSMGMTDQNKLKNTKLGDSINYYDNGVSGNGIVTKMSGQFIQIYKDDGKFYNININDTFHVSDILINKTWDAMDLVERTEQLMNIKAYSPRFLSKTWDQLPRELKEVMKDSQDGKGGAIMGKVKPKNYAQGENRRSGDREEEVDGTSFGASAGHHNIAGSSVQNQSTQARQANTTDSPRGTLNEASSRGGMGSDNDFPTNPTRTPRGSSAPKIKPKRGWAKTMTPVTQSSIEDGAFGNAGNSPTTGVSTKIPFDAPKDYEGQTHDSDPKQFKYEDDKPEVGSEVKAPEVKLDEQGLIKTGEFVYSDNPQGYKLPPKPTTKGYGMRYGVKYINEEEDKQI